MRSGDSIPLQVCHYPHHSFLSHFLYLEVDKPHQTFTLRNSAARTLNQHRHYYEKQVISTSRPPHPGKDGAGLPAACHASAFPTQTSGLASPHGPEPARCVYWGPEISDFPQIRSEITRRSVSAGVAQRQAANGNAEINWKEKSKLRLASRFSENTRRQWRPVVPDVSPR